MDFDGTVMEQKFIPNDVAHSISVLDYEEESTDYVKWQGSQTTCSALNQLINSSANEPSVATEVSTSRGWQREPSFDQIPGFSLLSTNDSHSSFPQSNSQASSSSLKYTRPSHSRPRPSLARARSPTVPPDVTNFDLPIPFLDKSNPSSFLDMLKGVSARLDENVGVRPRQGGGVPNSAGRPTKRVRGATSDLQAARPKRSRASAPGIPSGDLVRPVDKGKRRAVSGLEIKANNAADGHSTMSELPFPLSSSAVQSKYVVDNNAPMNMDDTKERPENISISHPPSDSVDPPFLETLSQTIMPPPPAPPIKHPTLDSCFRHVSSTSTSISPTIPNVCIQPSRSNLRPHSTAADSKSAKPDSGPRYHPLLLEQQNKASSSSSPSVSSSISKPSSYASKPRLPPISTIAPTAKPNPILKPKASPTEIFPSSTPKPPSSQSSRPPALGMRRTHTLPSLATSTSLKTKAALPTRQKGFKPPLLSASQPSSQPQPQHKPPQIKPVYDYATTVLAGPRGSNGSASSESLRGSASSSSGLSSHPSSVSPSSGRPQVKFRESSAASARASTPVPESGSSLPEPLDGDGDSSFGDMSFDMDALEETMRMYD